MCCWLSTADRLIMTIIVSLHGKVNRETAIKLGKGEVSGESRPLRYTSVIGLHRREEHLPGPDRVHKLQPGRHAGTWRERPRTPWNLRLELPARRWVGWQGALEPAEDGRRHPSSLARGRLKWTDLRTRGTAGVCFSSLAARCDQYKCVSFFNSLNVLLIINGR